MHWLPEPPPGTAVALGFDGSETSDWTGIRAETMTDGYMFTPRWGSRGTLWDPAQHGGRIPRAEVDAAVDELFERFSVVRMLCDPPLWPTEIEAWQQRHGDAVLPFETYRPVQMHAALERFRTDLIEGRMTHDGCPDTARHMANAKISQRKDSRYVLTKPDHRGVQKIDAAMMTVLAHEAAAQARAAGWSDEPEEHFTFGW